MPFSRLGPVTAPALERTSPVVGVSSPPTMRITVVLPQPDGPTKTTNSPSAMPSDSGSTTGDRRRRGRRAKTLVSSRNSMKPASLGHGMSALSRGSGTSGGGRKRIDLVGDEADDADGQDAGEHLRRLAVAPRGPELVADARVRGDDLGDDAGRSSTSPA